MGLGLAKQDSWALAPALPGVTLGSLIFAKCEERDRFLAEGCQAFIMPKGCGGPGNTKQ